MASAFPTFKGYGFDASTESRLSLELDRLCRIAGVSPKTLEASDLAMRIVARHLNRSSRSEAAMTRMTMGKPAGFHSAHYAA